MCSHGAFFKYSQSATHPAVQTGIMSVLGVISISFPKVFIFKLKTSVHTFNLFPCTARSNTLWLQGSGKVICSKDLALQSFCLAYDKENKSKKSDTDNRGILFFFFFLFYSILYLWNKYILTIIEQMINTFQQCRNMTVLPCSYFRICDAFWTMNTWQILVFVFWGGSSSLWFFLNQRCCHI